MCIKLTDCKNVWETTALHLKMKQDKPVLQLQYRWPAVSTRPPHCWSSRGLPVWKPATFRRVAGARWRSAVLDNSKAGVWPSNHAWDRDLSKTSRFPPSHHVWKGESSIAGLREALERTGCHQISRSGYHWGIEERTCVFLDVLPHPFHPGNQQLLSTFHLKIPNFYLRVASEPESSLHRNLR